MLKFVLCDDNFHILNRMSKMLESILIKHNFDGEILFTTTNPEEIIPYSLNNTTDVFILDIDLKSNTTGIDIARKIRDNNKSAYLIFTTAHLEYMLIAYKVKTFDFLAKPITSERLEETVIRLFEDVKNSTNNYIKIRNNLVINENDIYCIKKQGMKLVYCTSDGKNYEEYTSFNKVENLLPDNFIRCHKSYIVNVNKINEIDSNNNIINFNNNISCTIGPKYKNNLMEVINHGNFPNNMDSIINTK